jgi:predicted ATP-dependent Lon-type protease
MNPLLSVRTLAIIDFSTKSCSPGMAAAASELLAQMQMVTVGRMRVGGCVVAIDDNVAAVLAADSKLLAVILNAGYVSSLFCFSCGALASELSR